MKYKASFLIVLYNKKLSKSETINSFLKSKVNFENCRLLIWNNGPCEVEEDDLYGNKLRYNGFEVVFRQTINNISLASIYNEFCAESEADKYIILDDDSSLNESYLLEATEAKKDILTLPLISSDNKLVSPLLNGVIYTETNVMSNITNIEAIGSGMIIGINIISRLTSSYGKPFDERFFLYGVDTTFCYRFSQIFSYKQVKVINGFVHSLSRLNNESDEMIKFRNKERAYDKGLTLRYYYPLSKSLTVFIKTILISLINFSFRRNIGKFDLNCFIKAYLIGKHYRA